MKIRLNGEPHETNASSIPDLLAELELVPEAVLVEQNGSALHRSELRQATLEPEDQIEILRVVAGG